jgi:hypothetical protein
MTSQRGIRIMCNQGGELWSEGRGRSEWVLEALFPKKS